MIGSWDLVVWNSAIRQSTISDNERDIDPHCYLTSVGVSGTMMHDASLFRKTKALFRRSMIANRCCTKLRVNRCQPMSSTFKHEKLRILHHIASYCIVLNQKISEIINGFAVFHAFNNILAIFNFPISRTSEATLKAVWNIILPICLIIHPSIRCLICLGWWASFLFRDIQRQWSRKCQGLRFEKDKITWFGHPN